MTDDTVTPKTDGEVLTDLLSEIVAHVGQCLNPADRENLQTKLAAVVARIASGAEIDAVLPIDNGYQ